MEYDGLDGKRYAITRSRSRQTHVKKLAVEHDIDPLEDPLE